MFCNPLIPISKTYIQSTRKCDTARKYGKFLHGIILFSLLIISLKKFILKKKKKDLPYLGLVWGRYLRATAYRLGEACLCILVLLPNGTYPRFSWKLPASAIGTTSH